jgi:NADH-quinone oxidoreductase subunit L
MQPELLKWIPWIPALAAVLCGLCCARQAWRGYAAPICIGATAVGFVMAVLVYLVPGQIGPNEPHVLTLFKWIHVDALQANFGYFIDPLTLVMLFVVNGVGTLVAIYAAGYMKGDRGYARFFMGVSLFIFSMTTLVMADNLILLYLGWEGVGLCSYLLIGFYYERPSAVAAAKKAFIVNRIGDLGFALGIFLIYQTFGTVEYVALFDAIAQRQGDSTWQMQLIPFLLLLGALGKSAQLPLSVWLPDAMEGPTPVSALIHAATMVTAGVYMIARLLPVFELSESVLPVVALIGAFTALWAATIAMVQFDIKRILAYSTISQLGYMFLGLGVLETTGAIFHLFTHAFFKALLFLTAGSVMHALTGQLDLRKMSGLRKRLPITCWLMFAGCLALAGFPLTSGFFSKDLILAAVLAKGMGDGEPFYILLAVLGLVTAFVTAYYTFRLWFRVFTGPDECQMGDDQHDDDAHSLHEPHEVSWLMNGPLLVLAVGALLAGVIETWLHPLANMVNGSTAAVTAHAAAEGVEAHGTQLLGLDVHVAMMLISGLIAVAGIATAGYYHWLKRPAVEAVAKRNAAVIRLLANKYYLDEIYDAAIVQPLRKLGYLCFVADQLIVDGLVALVGLAPRVVGLSVRPLHRGAVQGYGLAMLVGVTLLIVWMLILD